MVATAKSKAAAKRRSAAPAPVPELVLKTSQPSRARGKAQVQPPTQATETIVSKLLAQAAERVQTKPSRALAWGIPTEPNFSNECLKESQRVAHETVSSILNEDVKKDDEASMLEMFRLAPSHPGLSSSPPTAYPVRQFEINVGWDDCVAGELGFPSAFEAIDLTDKRCILKKNEAQMVQKTLGEHPMLRKRKQGVPAGLKNLGATCYMNSLLQYLFFNAHFRSLMLTAASEVPAILELQRVFALLLRGEQKTVDPTKFVEAAAINATEEADATEFSALLLEFLDSALRGESSSLFKGELSKVMTCQENPAHRTSKVELFEELRASISPQADAQCCSVVGTTVLHSEGKVEEGVAHLQGDKKLPKKNTSRKRVLLEQLLQATSFADEVFDGDNLYACEQCENKKVVAKQTVHLQKAPPYLHVRFERYKFDPKKAMRTKLNLVISFPKALQLRVRAEGQDASDVVYDCVGYLEHVSDSAHSGHYTATLFHEDSCSASVGSEADDKPDPERQDASVDAPASSSTSMQASQAEPNSEVAPIGSPQKKRRVHSVRKGTWWKMDDCTVGRVQWINTEDQVPLEDTPQRISSASAYLLLYRRRDYSPQPEVGQGEALPGCLTTFLEGHNGKFQKEQEAYKTNDSQLQIFASQRIEAVAALRAALQKKPRGSSASDYLVVPNAWLRAFMRGEDYKDPLKLEDNSADSAPLQDSFKARPPMHQPILLPTRCRVDDCSATEELKDKPDDDTHQEIEEGVESGSREEHNAEEQTQKKRKLSAIEEALDPLAVWSGEVALLPKEAVDSTGDGSCFASASSLLTPDACRKARDLWCCWSEEFQALSAVEGSRVMAADLRVQPNNQILLADTVWLCRKTWNRFSKLVAKGTSKLTRWKLFLEEASAVRWGRLMDDEEQKKPSTTHELDGGKSTDMSSAGQASASGVKGLFLYEGILCDHGKVCKPKSAFLVPRGMLEDLLECSRKKEKAYKALWGNCRGMQRVRTGHGDVQLMASDEVCTECCPEWVTHFANPKRSSETAWTETCMLLLDTGRPHATSLTLKLPLEEGKKVTGGWLRKVATAKVGCDIAELYVPIGKGEQVLLTDDEVLDTLPRTLKADTSVRSEAPAPMPSEPEGDAFVRSIFKADKK